MQSILSPKPVQKEFSEMSKPEKKIFLANDLIERMVHIEQRVRGSMGEGIVPYYHTNYFKELRNEEKRKFVSYLKSKEVKKKWRFLPWVVILGFGVFAGFKFTGNAVASGGAISVLDIILILAFVVAIVFYSLHVVNEKKRWQRLEGHFSVIENILQKRRFKRK